MKYTAEKIFEQNFHFFSTYAKNFGEVVNETHCEEVLERLRRATSIRNKTFYLILNLKTLQVTWSKFVHQTIGFQDVDFEKGINPDNGFQFMDALEMIKQNYIPMYLLFGQAAYKTLSRFPDIKQHIRELDQEYVIQVPIRLKNGNYYWATQTSTPFELDKDNNLISHLNIYQINMPYDGQRMLKPMVMYKEGRERRTDLEKLMQKQLAEDFFEQLLGFNAKTLQLVKTYNEDSQIRINQAANLLKITRNTVMDYNKIIKERVNEYFSEEINPFPDARAASQYLGRLLGDYLILK